MKPAYKGFLLMLLIAVLPLIYLAIIYNRLPAGDTIPMHYNLDFKADNFGNKNDLLTTALIISGVSVLMYLLLTNLYKIDPKRRGMPLSPVFSKIAFVLVIFMSAIEILIIIAGSGKPFLIQQYLFPLIGLLFAFIGNYMNNIKPNYFAGIRLPWTLSSDDNWRRTHHLARKLWFWGGLIAAFICLIYPSQISRIIFFSIVVTVTIIPIIYSYRIFKDTNNNI